MIGRIRGTLLSRQAPFILVDVGGLGYELQVPMSTLFQLPAVGQSVTLVTHYAVREDAHSLYGFATERDRELFRHLIRISGIGPKLALAILSGMDADRFVRTVQSGDLSALVALPGVGKKTAERLLVEMRDRIKDWLQALGEGAVPTPQASPASDIAADAEAALVSLGYKPAEAARLVSAVQDDSIDDSETLIRLALKSTLRVAD